MPFHVFTASLGVQAEELEALYVGTSVKLTCLAVPMHNQ